MSYTLAYTGAEIDALLGKIDAIFVAEYGSTIYSEVTAAIAAGNKVIVANAGKVFVYAGTDDNSGYVFTQSGPNAAKPNATYVTLSTGNVWSTATVDLATLQQFYASLMEDTASGPIASFPDGAENVPVTELTAEIEPIQDLHGYDYPWPAGGSNNMIPDGTDTSKGYVADAFITYTGTVGSTDKGYVSEYFAVTGGATYTWGRGAGVASTDLNSISMAFYDSDKNYISGSAVSMSYIVSHTITAPVNATYARSSQRYAANELLQFEVGPTATVAKPYRNICPISGYTGAKIPVTGINLCEDVIYGYPDTSILSIVGGSYTSAVFYGKAGSVVSFSASNANRNALAFVGDSKPSVGSSFQYLVPQATHYTLPETGYYVLYLCNAITDNVQVNLGSTSLPYEAYNGQTYSVSWSDHGTVYKGTAQYKGGGEWEITADTAKTTVDNTWTYSTYSGKNYLYKEVSDMIVGSRMGTKYPISSMCEFGGVGGVSIFQDGKFYSSAGVDLYLQDSRYTTKETFVAAYSACDIVYYLATPTTFTVTGPDPETLLGDNNIWSDTGDISVRYRCNTALYIEKKLGE